MRTAYRMWMWQNYWLVWTRKLFQQSYKPIHIVSRWNDFKSPDAKILLKSLDCVGIACNSKKYTYWTLWFETNQLNAIALLKCDTDFGFGIEHKNANV